MKKNLDKLDSKFWSWFPQAIDNPKKIMNFFVTLLLCVIIFLF